MAGHQPSRTLVLTSRRPLLYVLWAVTSTCSNSVLCNTRPALPIPGHDQLPNWADLGSASAGTDGIVHFTDTNAPAYPHRFYRFVSP